MEENTNISWIKLIQDAGLEKQFIEAAKERSAKPTEENAKIFYEKVCKGGELSDEELDNVAGGCGNEALSPEEMKDSQMKLQQIAAGTCPYCGAHGTLDMYTYSGSMKCETRYSCENCKAKMSSKTGFLVSY